MFFPECLNIKKDYSVLEIGPGGFPFHRSDVLFDRFYGDEDAIKQSGGTGIRTSNKPLIVSDHTRLPFKNDAFDYLICSHVLEHVDSEDIQDFIDEMLRVAPRGYIEFPSIFYESFFDIPEHKNILFFKGNNLYIINKEQFGPFGIKFSPLYNTMRSILGKDRLFSRWIFLNKRLFFIGGEYSTNLSVKILTKDDVIPENIYPKNNKSIIRDIYHLLLFIVKNKFFNKRGILNKSVLSCPKCKSNMTINTSKIVCSTCGHKADIYL